MGLAAISACSIGLYVALGLRPHQPLAAPITLISQMGRISQTVVSPTGDRVVYCWNGNHLGNNLDLYITDLRTRTTRRLTSHPANEHSAAWSPDGSVIAFLRNGEGVFITTPDGQKQRAIDRARSGVVYGVGCHGPERHGRVFA